MLKYICFLTILIMIPGAIISAQDNSQESVIQEAEKETIRSLVDAIKEHQRNQPAEALEYGKKALRLLRKFPDPIVEMETLSHIGWVFAGINKLDSVQVYANRVAALAGQTGDPMGKARAGHLQGRILRQHGQYDEAIQVLNEALAFARETDAVDLQASILNEIGMIYRRQSRYEEAMAMHEEALKINQTLNVPQNIGQTFGLIGIIHDILGNYDEALKAHQQSLQYYEEVSDRRGMAGSYHNIGILNQKIRDLPEALHFYKQALAIWEEQGLQNERAATLNSIGAIYDLMDNYPEAGRYYQEALEIWQDLGNKYSVAIALENLGSIQEKLGNHDNALDMLNRAYRIREEVGDRYGMAGSLISIAETYSSLNKLDSAVAFTQRALEIAKEIKSWELLREAHEFLSNFYEKLGYYSEALEEYKNFKAAYDSVFNAESRIVVEDLKAKYRVKEQEQRIELLQQARKVQQLWISILIGGITLLLIIGILLFNRYRLKRRMHTAEAEQARLRTEAAETKARYLQGEMERKTQELQAARELQLSMLPNMLPEHPHFELAATMKTATEVGGDFYDFDMAPDGSMTVAIGDATGHGIPAGTIVTATKSLFNLLSREPDLAAILDQISFALRKMNFQKLFMAFAVLRFCNNTLEMVGAGMPSALILRDATKTIEEFPLKGLPLGSYGDFEYQVQRTHVNPGDVVLLMSDGFPELLNPEGEMPGFEYVIRELQKNGTGSPQNIIQHFIDMALQWTDNKPFNDDMTVIAIRKKAIVAKNSQIHEFSG